MVLDIKYLEFLYYIFIFFITNLMLIMIHIFQGALLLFL